MMLTYDPNRQHQTIVKIQRPIITNDPRAPWLLYGQGHSNMVEVPAKLVPSEIVHQMGEAFHAHFWGTYEDGWVVSKRTHSRNW